mmetsp:Transcript_16323/g.36725  ORF Transcript_16323/g.36725 Transcript_16323/m.36725 type:complete len:335 (-) Transcript_16323:283-1287(-)
MKHYSISIILCYFLITQVCSQYLVDEGPPAIGEICDDDTNNKSTLCKALQIADCNKEASSVSFNGNYVKNYCPFNCALVVRSRNACPDGSMKLVKCLDSDETSPENFYWTDTGFCEQEQCGIVGIQEYITAIDKTILAITDEEVIENKQTPQYKARRDVISARICPDEVRTHYAMYVLAFEWSLRMKVEFSAINPCSWPGVSCDQREIKEIVWLHKNLKGTIPEEIGLLKTLARLSLDQNFLSGSIPNNFKHLTELKRLDLDYNKITGSIPESIFTFKQLTWLDLDNNMFTGTLSFDVGQLQHLAALSLYNNAITGTVPESLSQLQKLREFIFC